MLAVSSWPQLGEGVAVIDLSGTVQAPACIAGSQDDAFFHLHWENGRAINGDTLYLRTPGAQYTLRLNSGADLPAVAAALLRSLEAPRSLDRETFFRQLLSQQLRPLDIREQAQTLGVSSDADRALLLIQCKPSDTDAVQRTLRELIRSSDRDVMVSSDPSETILILEIADLEDDVEYARAIADSLLLESGVTACIGISAIAPALENLPESLRQAKEALRIGRHLYPERGVYAHHELLLERLFADIPAPVAKPYVGYLFNEGTRRLLNEEMMNTIDCFLDCNLNLSETARKLFIHRNTLVYRLNKLQKAIGLDLRNFDDAATFRALYLVERISQS